MSTQHELDALRDEVKSLNAALTKQTRTTKRFAYGVSCLLVAGIAVAATNMQSMPDVIRAKHFHVVGDEGKIVAALGAMPDGGVLGILNKDGKTVATLSPDPDGGGRLVIRNNVEKKVASLHADSDGGGFLVLANQEKNIGAVLAATSDGGSLDIFDNRDNVTFQAPKKESVAN